GVALAVRSALLLAGRGRPRRGPRPAFVLAGPFLRARNPLYAGLVLALAGAALAGPSRPLAPVPVPAGAGATSWVVRLARPAGAGGRPSGPKIQAGRTCDPGRAAPARAGARRSGDTSVQACTDLLPPRVLPP